MKVAPLAGAFNTTTTTTTTNLGTAQRSLHIPTGDVHVVVAGDRAQSLGIVACARSLFAATLHPERVMLHVIADENAAPDIDDALRCALEAKHRFHVYAFDLQRYAKKNDTQPLRIRVPLKKHKINLASDLNFARFYLTEFLAPDVAKVVYLDADTIVLKDVATLYDAALAGAKGYVFAAVSRANKKICGAFLNCERPEVEALLRNHQIDDPENQLDAFNAGVMVMHLERWKLERFTEKIEYWIRWNEQIPLYDLASNPPLVLAARGEFEHLDEGWNCQRSHACWDAGNASALHWNGVNKPWNFQPPDAKWLRHVDQIAEKCLAKLPAMGGGGSPQGNSKTYPLEVKSAAMSNWLKASMNDTWRDFDLLRQATTLLRRGDLQPEGSAWWKHLRMRVVAEMERSIDAFERRDPPSLVGAARAFLDALEPPQLCDHVLIAVLRGRLYADVSAFAPGGPCGLVPPDNLISFLYFFSILLDQQVSPDAPTFDDVAFLVCTAVSSSRTVASVPSFLYAKRKGAAQPGIVVPGPAYVAQELDRRSDHEPLSARELSTWLPDDQQAVYAHLTASGSQQWRIRFEKLRAAAADVVGVNATWTERSVRATWRGRMSARYFSCLDDATWSRLEMLALSQNEPDVFDARLTSSKEEPDDIEFCVSRANLKPELSRRLTKILRHGLLASRPSAGALREYLHSRYVVMLPESKNRPDAHSSALWGVGASVLLWDSPLNSHVPRWLTPALENGKTHLTITSGTAAKVVDMLRQNDGVARYLALNARNLHDHLLCPACVRQFWAATLRHYRRHFGFEDLTSAELSTALKNANVALTPVDTLGSWFVGRYVMR
ncbi:hypothetical protein CTAYLR_001293 [Chrysophaeum taylorii]|uniref:Uncharacterized protein n=1 Tax=Chrysophaeum taylorii TaxID=2483200 RepID=A0AAD7UE06_9STRA|nr:hypothetical protein CTAYLR_001293 [Chrysophaeum taylorii]